MPAKHHSRAVKLAATFLARLASPEVAGATFGVDVRTVRTWQAGAVDLPDDQWEAVEQVLLARGSEKAARGEVSGLVQTLTGAGIAARNRRYATLIARREARRAGEMEQAQPTVDPIHEAANALSYEQQRMVAAELHEAIDATIDREQPPPMTDEEGDASFLAYLAEVAALSPEEVAARMEAAEARSAAIRAEYQPPPPPTVTLIEDGTPEGTRARLATDVTPGAPEPRPEPEIGKDGVWREVPGGEPWQWEAWKRYEQ